MTVKRRDYPAQPAALALARSLERACHLNGYRNQDDVFDDWITLSELALARLNDHLAATVRTGQLAVDPPPVRAIFERVLDHYKADRDRAYTIFAEALADLVLATSEDAPDAPLKASDLLGDLYMAWGRPNAAAGQFFSPLDLCRVMAIASGDDLVPLVLTRIQTAIEATRTRGFEDWLALSPDEQTRTPLSRFALRSLASALEPVRISDLCVGAGTLLLSAAEQTPAWMSWQGLVEYHGVDIDPVCVRMCRVNLMLHGIHPWHIVWGDSLALRTYADPTRAALGLPTPRLAPPRPPQPLEPVVESEPVSAAPHPASETVTLFGQLQLF